MYLPFMYTRYNFHSKQLQLKVYFFQLKIEFSCCKFMKCFNAQSAIKRTMQCVTESFLG